MPDGRLFYFPDQQCLSWHTVNGTPSTQKAPSHLLPCPSPLAPPPLALVIFRSPEYSLGLWYLFRPTGAFALAVFLPVWLALSAAFAAVVSAAPRPRSSAPLSPARASPRAAVRAWALRTVFPIAFHAFVPGGQFKLLSLILLFSAFLDARDATLRAGIFCSVARAARAGLSGATLAGAVAVVFRAHHGERHRSADTAGMAAGSVLAAAAFAALGRAVHLREARAAEAALDETRYRLSLAAAAAPALNRGVSFSPGSALATPALSGISGFTGVGVAAGGFGGGGAGAVKLSLRFTSADQARRSSANQSSFMSARRPSFQCSDRGCANHDLRCSIFRPGCPGCGGRGARHKGG